MEIVTIDRGTWLHGEGAEPSCLMRAKDGKKCCLGFRALQKGYSTDDILGKLGPSDLTPLGNAWAGILSDTVDGKTQLFVPTDLGYEIMKANDDPVLITDDRAREDKIIRLFKEIDIQVEFVGSYGE